MLDVRLISPFLSDLTDELLYFIVIADLKKFSALVSDNFRNCVDSRRIISKMLTDERFKFALESLKKCLLLDPKSNIFFSPHLIYQNLLVMYLGTTGDIESLIKKILNIPDDVDKATIQNFYSSGGVNQFCYVMNGPANSYACRIFSRFFINEDKVLYIETMNLFSSSHQVKEMTFDVRPELVRNFVNNSVTSVTQECIQQILPPNSIDNTTDAVLLNVIYCNGQLDYSYDFDFTPVPKKTKKDGKYSRSNNYNNGKFEELDAYVMELPLKENKISIFFFYPPCHIESDKNNSSEEDNISQLIERLTTEEGSQKLHKLLDDGLTQKTDMLFPTFNIEQDLDMHQLLGILGLQQFISSNMVHLREFTCNEVKISSALHRITIEMTKTSMTAAATNVFFTNNSHQQPKVHTSTDLVCFPCVCLIYDRSHRNILFCGILMES